VIYLEHLFVDKQEETDMPRSQTTWKLGDSGNKRGRPAKHYAMTEMLRMKGEEHVLVGGEVMSGREALAKAVWQFVVTGEVWLQGKKLEADTITEWLNAVKWLYTYVEPPKGNVADTETEMTVSIVRIEKPYVNKLYPVSEFTPHDEE
jgi:hypothetical protein